MKIVIPGGSGQIGNILARAFTRDGHDVTVLSRNPSPASPWRTLPWDGSTLGPWTESFVGADAVINLAGRSVNCRYTPENRREIMQSRVNSTRVLGQAIAAMNNPPRVWIQAGTLTIYSHRFHEPHDEKTGVIGPAKGEPETWEFSINVAKAWEKEINEAVTPNTRKVILRNAMTMSPDRNGVFDVLSTLARRGLGGPMGDGLQYVSWIHDFDFINAVTWLINKDFMMGPVNICSPYPQPNDEFMATLRKTWGVKYGLPAAKWMLEIGAFFMRTETELILKSRMVIPGMLQEKGFRFRFEHWHEAARDLCKRWKETA